MRLVSSRPVEGWGAMAGPVEKIQAAGVSAGAQTPNSRPDTALVHYFSGDWKGEGKFANGKPIEATLSFQLSLDSAWLVCQHRDLPPNRYKADFFWGIDRDTKGFEGYCFDNFNGNRAERRLGTRRSGPEERRA